MNASPPFLLHSLSPKAIEPDDLLLLAGGIKSLDENYNVRIVSSKEPSSERNVGSEDAAAGGLEYILLLWIPATVGTAVLNEIVHLAFDFGKQWFQEHGRAGVPLRIEIVRHQNERGEVTEIITITDAHSTPSQHTLSQSERYTLPAPPTSKDVD